MQAAGQWVALHWRAACGRHVKKNSNDLETVHAPKSSGTLSCPIHLQVSSTSLPSRLSYTGLHLLIRSAQPQLVLRRNCTNKGIQTVSSASAALKLLLLSCNTDTVQPCLGFRMQYCQYRRMPRRYGITSLFRV